MPPDADSQGSTAQPAEDGAATGMADPAAGTVADGAGAALGGAADGTAVDGAETDPDGAASGPEEIEVALTLRDAQRLVDRWMGERGWTYWHPLSQMARMTEELGELARVVNHLFGEKPKKQEEAEQDLGLEMADVLYTMICLANSQGIDLQRSLEDVLAKYHQRDAARYTTPRAAPGPRLATGAPGDAGDAGDAPAKGSA